VLVVSAKAHGRSGEDGGAKWVEGVGVGRGLLVRVDIVR
jgi:hypothetical protein